MKRWLFKMKGFTLMYQVNVTPIDPLMRGTLSFSFYVLPYYRSYVLNLAKR